MIPFDKYYYKEKIEEYNKKIMCGECGSFKIFKRDGLTGIIDAYLYSYEDNIKAPILELWDGAKTWMRISPQEIAGCYEAIRLANGRVGVVGLGLGYFVQEVLKNKKVQEVVVYETSEDVISLYKKSFGENSKVNIINCDAFNAKGEDFDFFFVDIYEYKISKQIALDYEKFIKLHNIKEYYFFGVEKFLLDCPVEDVSMVYIPEEWMTGARDLFEKLSDAGLLSKYEGYENKELVGELLEEFKRVL